MAAATCATAMVVEAMTERVAAAEVAVEGTRVAAMATEAAATMGATAAVAMGTGTAATEVVAVVDGVAGQNRPLCLQDLHLDFFQIAEDLNVNIHLTPSGEIWIQ